MNDLTLPGTGEASGPKRNAAALAELPAVDRLLSQPALATLVAAHGQPLVKRAINDELAAQRDAIRAGAAASDLPALVAHLARRIRPRTPPTFTSGALNRLADYVWPGNVRELANVVERAEVQAGAVAG